MQRLTDPSCRNCFCWELVCKVWHWEGLGAQRGFFEGAIGLGGVPGYEKKTFSASHLERNLITSVRDRKPFLRMSYGARRKDLRRDQTATSHCLSHIAEQTWDKKENFDSCCIKLFWFRPYQLTFWDATLSDVSWEEMDSSLCILWWHKRLAGMLCFFVDLGQLHSNHSWQRYTPIKMRLLHAGFLSKIDGWPSGC